MVWIVWIVLNVMIVEIVLIVMIVEIVSVVPILSLPAQANGISHLILKTNLFDKHNVLQAKRSSSLPCGMRSLFLWGETLLERSAHFIPLSPSHLLNISPYGLCSMHFFRLPPSHFRIPQCSVLSPHPSVLAPLRNALCPLRLTPSSKPLP
jgi:hypothetical protein